MYKQISGLVILFSVIFYIPAITAADFEKSYDDAINRRITIVVLHGDIKLSGYDGKNIEISAVKKGADSERVVIEDASAGNHINIFSRYLDPARNNATVDFEIRVPKEVFYNTGPMSKPQGERVMYFQRFLDRAPTPTPSDAPESPKPPPPSDLPAQPKPPPPAGAVTPPKIPPPPGGMQFPHAIYLKSNSGHITISDVAGSIRLEGQNIEARNVEGTLYAYSTSGDIKGVIGQASRRSVLQFSSSSGNISLQAPDDISAQVRIQSSSGQVKTDFPLETREMRYGSGKFIQGRLGNGNSIIDIRSLSGAIIFSKSVRAQK